LEAARHLQVAIMVKRRGAKFRRNRHFLWDQLGLSEALLGRTQKEYCAENQMKNREPVHAMIDGSLLE
jgi:hypothetical protein